MFKLAPSTFQRWEPPAGEEPDDLKEQLVLFEGGLTPDADPLDAIYEVILKEGYSFQCGTICLAPQFCLVWRSRTPKEAKTCVTKTTPDLKLENPHL